MLYHGMLEEVILFGQSVQSAAGGVVEAGLSFGSTLAQGVQSAAVLNQVLMLSTSFDESTRVTGDFFDGIDLGVSHDSAAISGLSITEVLSLAMSQGVADSVTISIEGDVSLSHSIAASSGSAANMGAALTMGAAFGIDIVSQAVINAGFSLDAIQSVTQSAFGVIVGVKTPDGRIIKVHVQDRTVLSEKADRTVIVH